MSSWKISGNTWTQTYGSLSLNPHSSAASNGVYFCEHICFTDRQKAKKKGRWREVWRMSWREEQKRRYPAAGCQHRGISTKCSMALQLQFRKKQLQLCSCISGPEQVSGRWSPTDVKIHGCVCDVYVCVWCVCLPLNRGPQMRPLTDGSSLRPRLAQFYFLSFKTSTPFSLWWTMCPTSMQ